METNREIEGLQDEDLDIVENKNVDIQEPSIKYFDRDEIEKKLYSTMLNKRRLIQKKGGFEDNVFSSYPKNEEGIRIAKPFNYSELRRKEGKRGIVYLQHTTKMLDNRKQVKEYFSRNAKVLRVEPKHKLVGNKPRLEGFYIEFPTKEIARQLIQEHHHKPFSKKISSLLTLKLLEDFRWSDYYSQDDRKKMIRKFILLSTEKELKEIQQYKKNLKNSKKISKNGGKMKLFLHKQKKVVRLKGQSTNHLSKMNFF